MSWHLFAEVFGVIFIAELPDKTALAALVLATRHAAAPVFLGSALALTAQSAIATAAGSLLVELQSRYPNMQHYVHIGAGVLFLLCAIVMWRRKEEDEHGAADDKARGFLSSLWKTFAVVFIAEWGDLTQIGTATLQAEYHEAITVFVASALALWAVAAIAVFIGNRAGRLLDPKLTQKIAAVVFAAIGVLLLVGVF